MVNEKWQMLNVKCKMVNVEWKVENGQRGTGHGAAGQLEVEAAERLQMMNAVGKTRKFNIFAKKLP